MSGSATYATQAAAITFSNAWVVANDEQGGANEGVPQNGNKEKEVRHQVVWGTLMAGGTGTEFYYGYQTGCSDLGCDNHRTRSNHYRFAAIAVKFFRDNLPFWEMNSMDSATPDNSDYVFGKAGEVYAVYRPNGGSTNLNVSGANSWTLRWFNPRSGQFEGGASNRSGNSFSLGNPPSSSNQDWVALVQAAGTTPNANAGTGARARARARTGTGARNL